MTDLEKLTAWHNAAKAYPILQKLFPPSETEESGKFFLWAGHYFEYSPGKWTSNGLDEDSHDSIAEALGGDGSEQMTYNHWAFLGNLSKFPRNADLLRTMAINYQWCCAYPDRYIEAVPFLVGPELEEWANDRIPSVEEIVKELEENPIKPDFPVEAQLSFGGI